MKTKLYLIPGIMCNEQLWSKITPLLKDEYELIHVTIPLKSSLDEVVETINSSIKESTINLLGFSLGGYIASYFACKYPNRINRLFIMAATPCDLPEEEIRKRESVISMSEKFGFKALAKAKIISLLEKENHDNEELINLIGTMYKDLGQKAFISQLGAALKREDLGKKLLELQMPIKFMYAQNDRLLNISWLEDFEKQSQSTFIKIKSQSHMLPLEKPVEVSKEIQLWFT